MILTQLLPTLTRYAVGTPEEVSSAVIWLLCDGASYVTGTAICVDGGSAFTLLPLTDIADSQHLPAYGGQLPRQAKL
jgi:peroxisomal trans-2-enoyl-CoA reductase